MFREHLMKALDSAVKHFNGGMSDNDAVVKAASDSQFNPDQTQRLLETYNTAKSVYFFKVANDRRESFPLADPAVVMPALFSGEARAKAKAAGALPDQGFYSEREFHYDGKWAFDQLGAHLAGTSLEKAAEVSSASRNYTLDALYRSLKKHADTNLRVAQRCRDTAGMCNVKHNDSLEKVAEFVKQDYHDPGRLAQVEHYMWALHGRDLAEPVMKDLLGVLPKNYAEKRASDRLASIPSDFEQRCPSIAFFVKEAFAARFAVGQQWALAETFEKEANDLICQWEKIAGLAPPQPADPGGGMSSFFGDALQDRLSKKAAGRQAPTAPPTNWEGGAILGGLTQPQASSGQPPPAKQQQQPKADGGGDKGGKKQPDSILSKALAGGASMLGGSMTDAIKGPASKALSGIMAGNEAEEERKMTGTLRNMQRKLILEDLIINDPVLSGEDPQAVVTAYHTLINLAPDVSLNKEIARSVVRASVNAVAMSPFDAKAIAELEGELRKNLGYTQPKPEGARA